MSKSRGYCYLRIATKVSVGELVGAEQTTAIDVELQDEDVRYIEARLN